jgi:Glycosyl hydrolases family 39
MRMRLLVYSQILLALLLTPSRLQAADPHSGPRGTPQVTFRDFSSVNHMPIPATVKELKFGWARVGFPWAGIEPKKGQWNWQKTDQVILQAHAEGVEILPDLNYCAPWAESMPGKYFSPPKNVEDWKDFVEHTVARYTSPPYNLRYFQVWNEPTRQAGFWYGTDRQFVDQVYLPAAKIIRSHGARVVFGGWPASNSLQEFDSVLSDHDAWRWTDILDIHYEGLSNFQYLYDHWVKTGKCKGIWETELGFTSDPTFIPVNYLQILHWALESGWDDPNQYKLFYYAAWGAGPRDGPNCLTTSDRQGHIALTDQGTRLTVINEVLGPGALNSFSTFSANVSGAKVQGNLGSALGFKDGHQIAIALFLNRASLKPADAVNILLSEAGRANSVKALTLDGDEIGLKSAFQGGQLKTSIPVRALLTSTDEGKLVIMYLVAET